MLKLFITPTAIVFEDLTDELYQTLTENYGIDFTIEDGECKVEEEPKHLYKLLYRLSCDYDIELN